MWSDHDGVVLDFEDKAFGCCLLLRAWRMSQSPSDFCTVCLNPLLGRDTLVSWFSAQSASREHIGADTEITLVSWCFELSQPLGNISVLTQR